MIYMKAIKVLLIVFVVVSMASLVFAAEVKRTAKVLTITGSADVKKVDARKWVKAETGMLLNEGDILRTGSDSWAMINLNGNGQTAVVEVEANSQLMLAELTKDEDAKTQQTLLDLAIGEILIKAQKLHSTESKFEVKTPTSVVGVRGTTFSVKVEALEE